jgi:hypothetical protein
LSSVHLSIIKLYLRGLDELNFFRDDML